MKPEQKHSRHVNTLTAIPFIKPRLASSGTGRSRKNENAKSQQTVLVGAQMQSNGSRWSDDLDIFGKFTFFKGVSHISIISLVLTPVYCF